MSHKLLALTSVFALVATTGFAQVKLEHKIPEGATYSRQTIASIDQELTIAGMNTTTKVENQTVTELKTGKRDSDGKIEVQERVKNLQIQMSGSGGEYRFDSVNPDDAGSSQLEVLRNVHKAVIKRVQTTVYDKKNRVVEIKSDKDILSKLPAPAQALAKSQLDPEELKKAANQNLEILPDKAVKAGDSWVREQSANFGGGQVMEFKTKYTYVGTVDKDGTKLDKITSKTISVKFSIAEDSPLPIKVKASKLKVKDSSGEILFDRKKGQITHHKETTQVVGDLTFSANGQELPAELKLKMTEEGSPVN